MMMDRNLILVQTQPDTCNNRLHFHTARYFHILILQNIGQKVTVCNKYSHQNVHQAKNFYISVLFSPEHCVRFDSKTLKKSAPNHHWIWHSQLYLLLKHQFWGPKALCKYEKTFWISENIQSLIEVFALLCLQSSELLWFGSILLATGPRHCSTSQLNTLY